MESVVGLDVHINFKPRKKVITSKPLDPPWMNHEYLVSFREWAGVHNTLYSNVWCGSPKGL